MSKLADIEHDPHVNLAYYKDCTKEWVSVSGYRLEGLFDVHAAVFLEVDKPQPVVRFELVKGWVTGTMPDVGEVHRVHR